MRIIKLAILSFIFLFLLVTIISLFIPGHIRISKATNIVADDTVVYTHIKDLPEWKEWHPALKNIPENEIAGWQQGNLVYDDETLEDIMADLQRIYNVNIQVADLSINGLKISTSFKREIGVEQALQVLCRLTDTKLIKTEEIYLIQ